jgi:hypothetical protein
LKQLNRSKINQKRQKSDSLFEKELSNEQFKNAGFECSRLIPEYQLEQANKILDRPIKPSELREIADEIYLNPSKYTDIISEIRKRRRSSLNMDK